MHKLSSTSCLPVDCLALVKYIFFPIDSMILKYGSLAILKIDLIHTIPEVEFKVVLFQHSGDFELIK